MMQLRSFLFLPLVTALAAACSKTPEPSTTSTPAPVAEQPAPGAAGKADAPNAAAPVAALQSGGEVVWDVPAGWESAPNPNAMRKATYKIKDAELSVSQAGGSVDANIQRWVGQFGNPVEGYPKRSALTVNNLKVTQVEMRGMFSGSGMPGVPIGEPKSGTALLGAIAEMPTGGMWFFKLTGPEKTVEAAKADFDKLVHSLRMK